MDPSSPKKSNRQRVSGLNDTMTRTHGNKNDNDLERA